MRAIATGKNHGVVFNLADGRYFVFIDCEPDNKYTGSNFDNHQPVVDWESCQAVTYDPRVSDKKVLRLDENNRFGSVFGQTSGLEYVLFNHLGQAHQQNVLVSSPNSIAIQSNPDLNGRADQIELRVIGGTGVTDILPMRTLD